MTKRAPWGDPIRDTSPEVPPHDRFAASRAKGATAERELARLAREALGEGFTIERNHSQTASGGHDLLGIGSFAVEIKRAETLRLRPWWAQAVVQAQTAGLTPALAFRRARESWGVLVPWHAVSTVPLPGIDADGFDHTVRIGLSAFFALVRGHV